MDIKKLKKINNELPGYKLGKQWSWAGETNADGVVTTEGFKQRIGGAAPNIATNAVGFAGSAINAYGPVKSEGELMAEAGSSVGYGTGFTYNRQNDINSGQQMSELSAENTNNTLKTAGTGAALGASIGSIFPGLGTVIGGVAGGLIGGAIGLLGGSSRKRRLQRKIINAQATVTRTNNHALASGQSDYLANQYNLEHDNTQDDQLYVARYGKDLKRPIWH